MATREFFGHSVADARGLNKSMKRKQTRREKFLMQMDQVVPWQRLEARIEPHYPTGENGRPAYPLSTMLRIHMMQHWYGLSDPAMADALYEITTMRRFAGLPLSGEDTPAVGTILNFRHLLERHNLAKWLYGEITRSLDE